MNNLTPRFLQRIFSCIWSDGSLIDMQTSRLKRFLIGTIITGAITQAWGQTQNATFSGFTPGNLVVTRSVYAGDPSVVTVGQALPPICPATAVCGTGKATNNGAYPALGSTNNVWNNNSIDGSFGITTPIFLDQITLTGTAVNTLPIPSNLINTSFSSKSEMAINLSTDGTVLTMMGYVTPSNNLDVSNSNTPGVYDPTNPAGSSVFRGVLQIGANGTLRVTPTNAYNGNNGRAAILANGLYYMVGNGNNGVGTPANVVASEGVQIATPGQSPATAPVGAGSFSITQLTDPTTGMPYAADKLGKDNNFRGLAIFNNTLYVTKGSGGNGVNTVYQVGTAGTLPTLATAATAPITVLPGFTTTLAKNATLFPFGIWFANANTLYVADEGDGTMATAASNANAGLQKWSVVNGKWQLAYVMQNGLSLGAAYSIAGYPTSLNPATGGLRNITGKVNGDGTVTIWAVTSTVSTNGDQGSDPNKLVAITDTLSNTTSASAAAEKFTTIKSAGYGEVLRGVSLTPTAGTTPMTNAPTVFSAATTGTTAIAPGSLAVANGVSLGTDSGEIFGPAPFIFGGTSVSVVDSSGLSSPAPLFYVSPNQVTFQVPVGSATGSASVTVTSTSGTQTTSNIQIAAVAPGLFTVNNSGLASAAVTRVSAAGAQTSQVAYASGAGGSFVPNPINLGAATDRTYLALFGTGIQAAGLANLSVTVGGVNAAIIYAGPQGNFPGLDQVNILLPLSLAGKGNVNVQLTASGVAANPVQITIQ